MRLRFSVAPNVIKEETAQCADLRIQVVQPLRTTNASYLLGGLRT